MNGQITLAQIHSGCINCFYEDKGECINYRSNYFGGPIPIRECEWLDKVNGSGGLPPIEELKAIYG